VGRGDGSGKWEGKGLAGGGRLIFVENVIRNNAKKEHATTSDLLSLLSSLSSSSSSSSSSSLSLS
jgi:hypothetical protein